MKQSLTNTRKKTKNRNTNLIFLTLFTIFCPVVSAQKADSIQCESGLCVQVGNLPEYYPDGDTIKLSLVNITDEMIYFSVSMEEKIGDEWIAVMPDIFRHGRDRYRARNVRILLPHEDKQVDIAITDLLKHIPKPNGLCRLRLHIKDSPFSVRNEVLSDEFLIE